MTRFAYSHFCDDVRAEMGNKVSAMGVYSGELYAPITPFYLPKLCCVLACATPVDRDFKSLAFKLRVDGNEIAHGEIPSAQLAELSQYMRKLTEGPDPILRYSATMTLVLSPYLITNPHVIKAYAIADGEEIPAGRLNIGVHKAVESPMPVPM